MTRQLLKTLLTAAAGALLAMGAQASDITGAGASFPYPVYAKWAEGYKQATGVGVNYQSIGSSGGIRQVRARTVAFGATDAPVSGPDLERDDMAQFPAIIGGTVPVINVKGFAPGELRITGPVLAEIFMGRITQWDDPQLAALNPGKTLPRQGITVVHRSDGSGTTFNWTDYLASVSPEWAATVGKGAAVKWPGRNTVGGKGNEGVAANVRRIRGAIGYVEYAFAKRTNLAHLQVLNKAGHYVHPSEESFAAAAAHVDWGAAPGMGVSMVNPAGDASWPIATASFILMPRTPPDKARAAEVLKFFDWAFTQGRQMALDMDYVPLPEPLAADVRSQIWSQIATR